jgi:isochorismate synthase
MRRIGRFVAGVAEGVPILVGFGYHRDEPAAPEWSGFPSSWAVVPQISVVRRAGTSRLVVAAPPGVDPASVLAALAALPTPGRPVVPRAEANSLVLQPSLESWRNAVARAAAAAASGLIEKVVLARSVRLGVRCPIDGFDAVALLADRHPGSRVFGWQSGERTFVGASPELLVAVDGTRFRTEALAGSAPRGDGPDRDGWLADRLLASAKDRLEHTVVVDEVVRRLGPHAGVMEAPSEPVVRRHATVQHLVTPIAGRTSATVLDLADALHPTPAVGGHPTPEALAYQAELESVDRGWYTGAIGWADASGDGEFAVALRCALITGDEAIIYVGNGIVAASDPDTEVEETRIKLRPMLDLFGGG